MKARVQSHINQQNPKPRGGQHLAAYLGMGQ